MVVLFFNTRTMGHISKDRPPNIGDEKSKFHFNRYLYEQ